MRAGQPLGAQPVSWNQSQLLTVHHAEGATAAYNIPMPYWLVGPLQPKALRGALSALVERHQVLRTTYEVDDDGFTQRVGGVPEGEALLREVTASEEGALALVAADAARGFELMGEGGSVMRCTLVRVEAERHLLLINVHHVAFDGGSTGVLLEELGALYRALSAGGTVADAELPVLRAQYVDYALWQRGVALEAHLTSGYAYWRAQLREGDLPVLELPTDLPRPAVQTFSGACVGVVLPLSLISCANIKYFK